MKLTNNQIIKAIFNATLQQLPRESLMLVDGGYTLTPDVGYWMDRAIKLSSSERINVIDGLTPSRLHALATRNHIQTDSSGRGFTFNLPDEQLGQCWFRTRAILRATGIPDYDDKPVVVEPTPLIESTYNQLMSEFSIESLFVNDSIRWRIISHIENYLCWYPQTEPSLLSKYD